jgi:hypothetical protein
MLLEAIAAVLVGMAALLLVLSPLLSCAARPQPPPEPLDPEETPRGVALTALKEIDFDRETGKLSEADYQFLKAKYTAVALEAMRAEEVAAAARAGPSCRTCGPRPELDAVFCSTCGLHLSRSGPPEHEGRAGEVPAAAAALPINPLQAG